MLIGDRLREIREVKKLTQGDIERRTGLFRCYISRVENDHLVPSLETLEKFARALEIPIYQLFYEGEKSPPQRSLTGGGGTRAALWGSEGKHARELSKFSRLLAKLTEQDRTLLLQVARRITKR